MIHQKEPAQTTLKVKAATTNTDRKTRVTTNANAQTRNQEEGNAEVKNEANAPYNSNIQHKGNANVQHEANAPYNLDSQAIANNPLAMLYSLSTPGGSDTYNFDTDAERICRYVWPACTEKQLRDHGELRQQLEHINEYLIQGKSSQLIN
jgi:hypothetical protein